MPMWSGFWSSMIQKKWGNNTCLLVTNIIGKRLNLAIVTTLCQLCLELGQPCHTRCHDHLACRLQVSPGHIMRGACARAVQYPKWEDGHQWYSISSGLAPVVQHPKWKDRHKWYSISSRKTGTSGTASRVDTPATGHSTQAPSPMYS